MNKKLRYLTTYTALIALLLILSGVSIAAGSISIPAGDIFKVLAGGQADSTYAQIITGIRIPRVLAAIFLGGALSLSGYLLQTFFANPIAGPFVLGISQGAKLVVALTLILTLRHGLTPGSPGLILAAFMGSLISTGFILLISRRTRKMSLLVICGIMIGYICSAVTDFVITFANDSDIVNLHSWSQWPTRASSCRSSPSPSSSPSSSPNPSAHTFLERRAQPRWGSISRASGSA